MDETVHKWALSLTLNHKVHSSTLPLQPLHFSSLTKDKKLQPVLAYLVRHVRSAEERRLIRLNLKHAQFRERLEQGEGEIQPSEEQLRLQVALTEARSAITAEVAEIQQLNQKKEQLHQREWELRHRAMLVRVAHTKCEGQLQQHSHWSTQLAALIPKKKAENNKSPMLTLQRKLSENIGDFQMLLASVIDGTFKSQDDIHNRKVCLWEQVDQLLEDWKPEVLLGSLVNEVQESRHRLQSMVQNVNLVRDAHALRMKCESDGSFIDEMNPGGVIESVRELLTQMSAAHVKLYIQAHQTDQAAQSLTRALDTLHNNITSVAKRVYPDEAVAAAVATLVRENINLEGERATLSRAQVLTEALQQRVEVAAQARNNLRQKYTNILNFEKEVQERKEKIQCLTHSVGDGWPSIQGDLAGIRSAIGEDLASLTHPTPVALDALHHECQAMTAVPLAYLLTSKIDGHEIKQKVHMSTTSLLWHDQEDAAANWQTVNQLCSGMPCWEGVYNAVCDKINLATSLANRNKQLTYIKAAKEKTSQTISNQDVKELSSRVKETDQKLHEEISDLVQHMEQQLTVGCKLLTTLNRQLTDWWEQPAKSIIIKKN